MMLNSIRASGKCTPVFTLPKTYPLQYVAAAATAAKSLQSCPTRCDPIDSSPPGFPIPGIFQTGTLEWVAISFSSSWKWKVKGKSLNRVWLFTAPWTAAYQALPSMDFPGKNTGVGCHCYLRHYSILAWKTPWTEEPCSLQSLRMQKSWTPLND